MQPEDVEVDSLTGKVQALALTDEAGKLLGDKKVCILRVQRRAVLHYWNALHPENVVADDQLSDAWKAGFEVGAKPVEESTRVVNAFLMPSAGINPEAKAHGWKATEYVSIEDCPEFASLEGQLGYVLQKFALRADVVWQALGLPSCTNAVTNLLGSFRRLIDSGRRPKVVTLGCGPGNDTLGVVLFLHSRGFNVANFDFVLSDLLPNWAHGVRALSEVLGINASFVGEIDVRLLGDDQQRLETPTSLFYKQHIQGASLVLSSFLWVEPARGSTQKPSPFKQQLIRGFRRLQSALMPGGCVLAVDIANPTTDKQLKEIIVADPEAGSEMQTTGKVEIVMSSDVYDAFEELHGARGALHVDDYFWPKKVAKVMVRLLSKNGDDQPADGRKTPGTTPTKSRK